MDKPITVEESNINELFGRKIRALRMEQNLSQEEMAWQTGMHRTYIGQIERAEKNITIKNVAKIASALGIDIKELFDFDNLL